MQWRKLTRLKSSPGGQSRARRMLCCGRRKDTGRAAPDITASPGRAPPPQPPRTNHATCVLQPDFRKVSGVSNEIFRQIEMVENDHDATTAAALEAVESRGEMIVRILELRQVGRNNIEAAKQFFSLQDTRHIVQLVEIVKRPGQTLGLYIREGDGGTRTDGVFISRIALESAVYISGCLKVGDEILAVNLVDVRRMSLDDVVIIMSIPRRLLLCTRQRRGKTGPGSPSLMRSELPRPDHKPTPVVVLKRDCRGDDEERDRVDGLYSHSQHGTLRSTGPSGGVRPVGDGREERSRMQLGQLSPDSTPLDLYYNSRPPSDHSTWSYRPPPPVITEQPKSGERHFVPYERSYPNTLESLAEKVNFYQAESGSTRFGSSNRVPRSGSEQQLPRAETHSDFGRHSLLRSSLKASGAAGASSLSRYNQRYGLTGAGLTGTGLTGSGLTGSGLPGSTLGGLPSGLSTTGLSGLTGSSLVGSGLSSGLGTGLSGTLGSTLGQTYGTTGLGLSSYSKFGTSRRNRSLDYSSDTEATAPNRTPYYSGLSGYRSSTLGRDIGSKFNSLPRDVRNTGQRLGLSRRAGSVLQDEPEPLSSRLDLRSSRGRLPSSPSVFTSDEYRAWLSRAPSTSALYETLRPRLPTHYSAENIHDALKNMENASRFGSTLGLAGRSGRIERPRHLPARSLSSQQLGPTGGSPSARRVRQLLELGSRFNCPNPSPVPTPSSRHQRHVDINPSEFLKYKVEKTSAGFSSSMTGLSRLAGGISGMLWVHLLAGRGLRIQPSGSSPGSPPMSLERREAPVPPRDLYCVLECDRVHKARTVVRNGELQFNWDESFELELVENCQLDILVYSWDPQHRHKLCYRGAVGLPDLLTGASGCTHQLAIKMEPRGTLYVRVRHTEPTDLFRRRPAPPRLSPPPLFGAELEAVVSREVRPSQAPPVPLIVRRCVEEIERRGLDIIGLYRLCGSANKKRILREAFERNTRGVELNPDSVPDINVITGLLKDYLRELPQPLFSRCLYQMTLDALGVCLPDDREGNARLMASIVECLPRAARATLVFLLDHLALVVASQDRNKMSPHHLAVAMAPPLMLHTQTGQDLDYQKPINALQCLLQIWPAPKRSGRVPSSTSPYRPPAAASAASVPAPSARPAPDRSPPAHVLSSVRGVQFRPQSPLRGPLPAPPRSRQVTVSSPGSPSSSSGSHSPADTIKHGGSVSSILRQPERSNSPRHSPRHSPRNSPRDSPRSTPRESSSSREMTPRELTPREAMTILNPPIVRDQIAREQMARDTMVRESLARDQIARETLARDQNREALRENVAREAARDQLIRDQIRDVSPREQITRELMRDHQPDVISRETRDHAQAMAREAMARDISQSMAREALSRDQMSQATTRDQLTQAIMRDQINRDQLSQSLARDQMNRESGVREQVTRESLARDQMSRESMTRDQMTRESVVRDQIARDSMARDQMTRESMARDQMTRDSKARDQMTRDSLSRDQNTREVIARDQMARESMARDQINRDSISRDQMSRDSMTRDQMSRDRDTMTRDRDQMNRDPAMSRDRDQMSREMMSRDQLTRESMSRELSGSRESPRSAIPGTSAGLAVTLQAVGAVSPRYNTATNPFLQQYDAEAEAEAWAADIFSPPAHT